MIHLPNKIKQDKKKNKNKNKNNNTSLLSSINKSRVSRNWWKLILFYAVLFLFHIKQNMIKEGVYNN